MGLINRRLARLLPLTASVFGLLAGPNMTQAQAEAQASGTENPTLEEIIVIAQRREQSVLDIPSGVAVISGEQIRDQLLRTSHALQLSTPGLTFHEVSGTSQVTLRNEGGSFDPPSHFVIRSSRPPPQSPVNSIARPKIGVS